MNIVPRDVLHEVIWSTKTAWRNGSFYEFSLPTYLNFEKKDVKVGFKNIRFPEKKQTLKLKLCLAHVLEKVDLKKALEYEVTYKSFPDLCHQLDAIAYDSLAIEGGGLDFRWNKNYDLENSKFIVSFTYENGRVILRKNIDYILYISQSLDNLLQFGSGKCVVAEGCEFFLLEKFLCISDYCSMIDSESEVVYLVVHDMIESLTCGINGLRYPIGCSFQANIKNYVSNEFISFKNVSVPYLKKIRCSFLNANFKNFDFDQFDLTADPIMFTATFFLI